MSAPPLPTDVTYNSETAELDRTMGLLFIGYSIAMVLYGLNAYQAYIYYSTLQGERLLRKWGIGLLTLLDTASVATLTEALHFYMITEFPRSSPAVVVSTNTFTADNLLAVIMVFIAQTLYAHKIQKHSGPIAAAVALLSTVAFGLGIAMTAFMINNNLFASFGDKNPKFVIAFGQGCTLLASMITFAALQAYEPFRASPNDTRKIWYDYPLDILVDKNGLAALVQLGYFVSFVAHPSQRYWMIFMVNARRVFFMSLVSLYINSAIANGKSIVNGLTSTNVLSSTGSATLNSKMNRSYGAPTRSINSNNTYVNSNNTYEKQRKRSMDDESGMAFRVEVVKTVEHDDYHTDKH